MKIEIDNPLNAHDDKNKVNSASRLNAHNLPVLYKYGGPALDHLNFDAQPGEFACLVGANSAGKPTVIKLSLYFILMMIRTCYFTRINIAEDRLEAKRQVPFVSYSDLCHNNSLALQISDFLPNLCRSTGLSNKDCYRVDQTPKVHSCGGMFCNGIENGQRDLLRIFGPESMGN